MSLEYRTPTNRGTMKDHFALLPESDGYDVEVVRTGGNVMLWMGGHGVLLTPTEARQIAAALNRAAALRPVPAA